MDYRDGQNTGISSILGNRVMSTSDKYVLDEIKAKYADKFVPEADVFSHVHRGDRIFVSTGCGEPRYLINALIKYVESNPKAFFDAEIIQVWTLGVAPYTEEKYKANFRHNSFFVGNESSKFNNSVLSCCDIISFKSLKISFLE